MKINNAGEFVNFIKSNGLSSMAPELPPLINCMTEYSRLCACDSIDVKNKKLKQCREFYINFIKSANKYKSALLSKTHDQSISFCIDNQTVVTLTR